MAAEILDAQAGQALVLADSEHFTAELLDRVKTETNFDLLVPMPDLPALRSSARRAAAGSVPAALGRLRDCETPLYAAGQPSRTVLPIRPAARGAAGGIPLQSLPLDPRWR